MTQVKIEVPKWLTRTNENPVPMRKMRGELIKETPKALLVKLTGYLEPSKECLHCGKKLTHKISLYYGIGPICGAHFYIVPPKSKEELEKNYEEIKRKMENVQWEGWLPKSHITIEIIQEKKLVLH